MAIWYLSFLASAILATALAVFQPEPVPAGIVALCALNGTICFRHVFLWASAKIDTADPLGLTGLAGVAIFLISPIMQIGHDYWPFVPALTRNHEYILLWTGLTFIGLIIFACIAESKLATSASPAKSYWSLNFATFVGPCILALILSLGAQIFIFAKFGGVAGFVSAFTERQELQLGRTDDDPFQRLGLIMVVAESFKYLFAMLVILYFRNKEYAKSIWFFFGLMAVLLPIFLLFGGLRGSRSSTLLSLVYAAFMYHGVIRRIPVKVVIIGLVASFTFLNAYYWYKIAGIEGIPAIYDERVRTRFAEVRQDSNLYVIVRDLGRTDVQTLGIIRREENDMPLRWGVTYLGAPFTVIPTALVPEKPEDLLQAKLDLVYGPGRVTPDFGQTTIVLGGAGEAFVNFGYAGFLLSFAALGWIVRRMRRLMYGIQRGDARTLLIPAILLVPVGFIMWDAGLLFMVLVRALLLPLIVILAAVQIYKPQQEPNRSPVPVPQRS